MAKEAGDCFVMQATHPDVEIAIKNNPHWKVIIIYIYILIDTIDIYIIDIDR